MARQHDSSFGMATSRGPKYRTSCDNCQAAKVKCGQGKPACRRCSVHRLECVYSLSRRMGRPRAKRSGITAQSSRGTQSKAGSSDNNTTSRIRSSRPPTPTAPRGCAASETTATITVAAVQPTSPFLETWDSGESTALPGERDQGQVPWSPLAGGEFGLVGDSGYQSTGEPLGFLPTDTPMDLDGVSRCLEMEMEMEMPSFLQNPSTDSTASSSEPPIAADAPENPFGSPLDLLLQMPPPTVGNHEKDLSSFSAESHLSLYDTKQQQHFGPDSDLFPQMAGSPRQSIAPACAMDQMLDDYPFDLASSGRADGGHTLSQGTTCFSHPSSSTNPSVCRHGGAAPLLSPPRSENASLRRLPMAHDLGSFLDKRVATADEEEEEEEEDEDEDEEEEASFPSSSLSSLSSSPSHRPQASSNEQNTGAGGHCGCVSAVSQCIVSLRTAEQQQRTSSPLSLDSVLLMEGDVAASLGRLDRCKTCRRESAVHLLALVGVRMMLHLLQKTVRDEFASRRRPGRDLPAGGDNDFGPGHGRGAPGTLWIGKFKVTPRARFRFLRRLLQARFYRLAVLVEEREKWVHGLPSRDCFAGASSLLLADISQALRTVMGWLELWKSKP